MDGRGGGTKRSRFRWLLFLLVLLGLDSEFLLKTLRTTWEGNTNS